MLHVFQDRFFEEYYTKGYIDTGVVFDDDFIGEMRAHYAALPERRNDYPRYFEKNEHQAWLESRLIGLLFSLVPGLSSRAVEKLYGAAYNKAAHAEQVFIERVCEKLLQNGFGRFFKTRYLVASYDIYLGNDHNHRSFTDIHSDIPNFHHFYETEDDITIYLPLIDVNAQNGGRLSILPEARGKLKVPGNVLLKLIEDFFGTNPKWRDENGYIDPDRIGDKEMKAFANSPGYQQLMQNYKSSTALVRASYADDFVTQDWRKGQAVIFTNKNFHAAESWRNETKKREIYMLRLLPVYDCRIKLKNRLHGKPFNLHLIDLQEGVVRRFDEGVDLSRIADGDKLRLHARDHARRAA